MRSRLDESITRTRRPDRAASPLPIISLPLLAAALLLALGWAIFFPSGDPSERQAQAQTSGAENGNSGGDPAAEDEELSYAAFGDRRNPFASVVQPKTENTEQADGNATEGDGGGDSGPPNGDSEPLAEPAGDGMEDQGSTAPDDDTSQRADGGSQEDDLDLAPPASGAAAGSGADNVNCQNPADDFEELLCEEGAPGSDGEGTTSAQPGGSGETDDDRDGGSGRSGAGEPTDTFRNGGPAPGK